MSTARKLNKDFDEFVKQIKSSTPVEVGEASHIRKERVDNLLGNWPAFLKYYFPKWCSSDFAHFHLKGGNAVMESKEKKMIFAWAIARNMSKTTFWQMMAIYINCRKIAGLPKGLDTGLFMSKTYDQASKQLTAMRLQFEFNQRLINDFGQFKSYNAWGEDFFATAQGISWLPLGKGQSPRGVKNEDLRVNFQLWDDFDDDEECINDIRLDKSWDWITKALLPTLDVSAEGLVVALNNIIHERSLMTRIMKIADWSDTVNLLDNRGRPSWPARHSLEDCNYMISKIGTRAAQGEYFNNPITEGKVFKKEWIQYKAMPSLDKYNAIIAYLDPSFSNKKNADHKSWIVVGLCNGEIHVIKAYCNRASVEEMIEWGYEIVHYVKERKGAVEMWMEEVFLQSLLYKDFHAAGKAKGWPLPLQGDTRKKPDKDQRISAQAGHFERGNVYFNEEEKDNHHMVNLIFQFTSFQPGHTGIKKDGPDSFEGGVDILFSRVHSAGEVAYGKRVSPKNLY
jgi:hypothetical protein